MKFKKPKDEVRFLEDFVLPQLERLRDQTLDRIAWLRERLRGD